MSRLRASTPPEPNSPEMMLRKASLARTSISRAKYAQRGLSHRGGLDRTTRTMLLRQLYLSHMEARRFAEALLIAEHPDHAENIRNFPRCWHEMVPHAYEDSVALLEGLIEDGHDVTLLTNWASDTFREARARFPFLEKPRGVTVSGDIGLIKPDRAIYDHHVASFGLDPAASLFIDDSQKNVDGAKAAGWQAVLFTDAKTLKADLERLGISA